MLCAARRVPVGNDAPAPAAREPHEPDRDGHARADTWLRQAGVGLGLFPFVAGSLFAGLLAMLVVTVVSGSVFVAFVPGIAVAAVPRGYFGAPAPDPPSRGARRVARRFT